MRSALAAVLLLTASGARSHAPDPLISAFAQAEDEISEAGGDDPEFKAGGPKRCSRASPAQRALVNRGNAQRERYLQACAKAGVEAHWCEQSTRPNPDSRPVFECTYGPSQPHQLIHPDQSTWTNAFKALRLVAELGEKGINACLINNWWRPEPYNNNVGGAAARHPLGTAVDVRFCTPADRDKAFAELCRQRSRGRLRALGYYPESMVLHVGVADRAGNTWGKECP